LNRKDDLADGGTRVPNRGRKWRTCSVVLTGSSLLFFKNLNWYREIEEGGLLEEGGHALHGALQGADEGEQPGRLVPPEARDVPLGLDHGRAQAVSGVVGPLAHPDMVPDRYLR